MLHIIVGPERRLDEPDELGRDRTGFVDTMSDTALYDASRGSWVLGERADNERYALVSHAGIVRLAIGIDALERTVEREPADTRDHRRAIVGRILKAGHPVHNRYVGKESPIQRVRNPITYFDSDLDQDHRNAPCLCGCGAIVQDRDFLPGHDQTALHDRVKQIGTVAEFLAWFDIVRGTKSAV